MRLVKSLLAAVFVCALVGNSPDWSPAAEITKAETQKAPSKTKLLDINTASIDDLKALPGIGDAYAQKIETVVPTRKKTNSFQGKSFRKPPTIRSRTGL